ncbi:hypothetical protein QF000_003829 [Paraburkholderia atlantica]|uniref:hypothetical protein n=1 Tax=Paraburkholderia atlantica TaxID=2654982 RepID=UPI0015918542|nr:hypothetical protein [Paraburkholderia atlantica]MBB5418037.1 hypothetical protein [Paraburkholderia atlantica]NUY34835.1 hypothetical protein [Paraburkholderia atlantica]
MKTLSAQIASVSDRENLVFEIWYGGRQVAEISKEPNQDYAIEIFPAADGKSWHLDLSEFNALLNQGIKELERNG